MAGLWKANRPACYVFAMFASVQLLNFRCFRDVTVRLGPLTAIVGPNASGKTALLRAISGHEIGLWRPLEIAKADDTHESARVDDQQVVNSARARYSLGGLRLRSRIDQNR